MHDSSKYKQIQFRKTKKDPILRTYRLYTKKADIKGIKVKTDKSQHPFITKTQKIRIE